MATNSSWFAILFLEGTILRAHIESSPLELYTICREEFHIRIQLSFHCVADFSRKSLNSNWASFLLIFHKIILPPPLHFSHWRFLSKKQILASIKIQKLAILFQLQPTLQFPNRHLCTFSGPCILHNLKTINCMKWSFRIVSFYSLVFFEKLTE